MSSVWAFSLVYNEAVLAPYLVRHYLSFCDRVILFVDVDTTDGTEALAEREGADVRPWDGHGIGLDDVTFASFASEAYKEAVGLADWVIWVDADEIIYHPRMQDRLDEALAASITFPTTDYYVMVSDQPPSHDGQIYDHPAFQQGIFVQRNAKTFIFNPNQTSVTWDVGKHASFTTGSAIEDDGSDPILALHYRWLGADYLAARDARNYARLSDHNKHNGFGIHVHPGFVGPYMEHWVGPAPSSAKQVIFPQKTSA